MSNLQNYKEEWPAWLPVGSKVIDNLNFLKRLSRSSSDRSRWRLLRRASTDELLALVEICTNYLRPYFFILTDKEKTRLSPFADKVRKLSRIRTERGARRYVIQHGSGPFFTALLVPIITEAAGYILSKLTKKNAAEEEESDG
jgi:hypothetical protein